MRPNGGADTCYIATASIAGEGDQLVELKGLETKEGRHASMLQITD